MINPPLYDFAAIFEHRFFGFTADVRFFGIKEVLVGFTDDVLGSSAQKFRIGIVAAQVASVAPGVVLVIYEIGRCVNHGAEQRQILEGNTLQLFPSRHLLREIPVGLSELGGACGYDFFLATRLCLQGVEQ
ncbi:hypothetical protein KT71_001457 [Congregibacter litoralis KT71]|uniref:Uncharacterized protein n=1 Tax=Congregibacter litoralis KT71 TaxID=314285 RepID=V7HUZ7_9GAMM|nr:hypothetical protein KT71_001457 [Congregibacter litoralis KT71]